MLSDEAAGITEPRSRSYTNKSEKRTVRNYCLMVITLLTVVMMLCISNFTMYKSYRETRLQTEAAYKKAKSIIDDRNSLDNINQSLQNENSELRNKYHDMSIKSDEILKQLAEIKRQNEELAKRNKELIDDNIALQNSLKMAASVGIKPQSFTQFNGLLSRGDIERGTYLGRFLGTAYTPSKDECGNDKGITNSGKPIIPGISVAIDGRYWPFGTVFYIKGLGYAVAMDTGGAIKGKNRFDFAVFDKKFANKLGERYWDVYLVKMGNGKIGEVKL